MFHIAYCYPQDMDSDFPDALKRLAHCGIEGMEFWDASIRKHSARTLKDACDMAGLQVAQICPYFNFVDSQETYDETMKLADEYLAFGKIIRARLVRVFTGKPWGGPTVGPDDATPEQWDRAVKGLQRICDLYAAKNGPALCLECHAGSLMETSESTLRLLEDVGRRNLLVNLQLPLGGKAGPEDIWTSVKALAGFTDHMHIHNYPKDGSKGICSLRDGKIDYEPILKYLVHHGFDGYVSLEHPTAYVDGDMWQVAEREAAYLAELRARM
jgi:sugar phosphate isomerase/epimerase